MANHQKYWNMVMSNDVSGIEIIDQFHGDRVVLIQLAILQSVNVF